MELQPLNSVMVRQYLEETGGDYSVDEDGDFVVEYERNTDSGCELTVYLSIVEEYYYSIQIVDDRSFPPVDWDRLVWLCNTWNAREMYPTAYLFKDEDDPNEADIRLEHTATFKFGVSEHQLRDLTEEMIETAFDFWDWAHREHGV